MIYFHQHTSGNNTGSYGKPHPSAPSGGSDHNANTSYDQVDSFANLNPNSDAPQQLNGEVYRTFPNRQGYDANFLGAPLALPTLDDSIKNEAAPLLADPSKIELKYTHFSVIQDKDRCEPLLSAVNIDGTQMQALPRKVRLTGRLRDPGRLGPGNHRRKESPPARGSDFPSPVRRVKDGHSRTLKPAH
jgi:hypothetical protein